MHNTCVWLVQVIFYDRRVLRASQQNILHPHIMSLLGVPALSTFCSTPPPSRTPSPQTLTGIRSNSSALRQENGQFGPLATRHPTTSLQKSFVKNEIACLVRIVLCERLGRKNPNNVVSSPLPSVFPLLFFCNVFSEISAFTQYFPFYCPFSVWRNTLFFLNRLENTISPFCCKKKLSFFALCCWGLYFRFAICCWIFQKQNKHLYSILLQKLFWFFLIFCWQLSVLWSQWHRYRPRVIRCIKPFHFISLSSHVSFSKVFSSFTFFYDNVFFVVSLWCPSLFLLYLAFSSFGHLFVFPTFLSSHFFFKQILFRSAFVLSLFLWALPFFLCSFFTKRKLRCLQCFLVHVFVF